MNYFSGVYIPDTTTGLLGGHCVKIVGWGEDAGEGKGGVERVAATDAAVVVLLLDVHAVAVARIDVHHAGVPYWTVANSWGLGWGA